MLALLVWGNGGILDLLAVHRQIIKLQEDVRSLKEGNTLLKKEIKDLKSDPDMYERVARERYFMKKKGEVVVYLPEKKKEKETGEKSGLPYREERPPSPAEAP